MIAETTDQCQAPSPALPARLGSNLQDHGDIGADEQCCPTYGRPSFGSQASGLLDLLILAQNSISRAKAAVESVVGP
jgi:hypothetical protein